MSTIDGLSLGVIGLAMVLAGVRWLRVAQREHYLAGSATRFALRWWFGRGPNRVLAAAVVLGAVLSPLTPLAAAAAALALSAGPFGLPLLGRTPGRLAFTRRLRTLAGVVVLLHAVVIVASVILDVAVPTSIVVAMLSPGVVDLACALLRPFEERAAGRFVNAAASRLREVDPLIVAITGSYGKTSTKVYLAHLCAGARRVVPTPASYNNRAGLSRAVTERLTPGTEVFIAEMGTYGPGEIRDLCSWCPPRVAAITAIGPVHLERFGDEDAIVVAKAEILDGAETAVLNVDDPRLAALADQREGLGQLVLRCSGGSQPADARAVATQGQLTVTWRGEHVATIPDRGAQPTNVAVAVAIAIHIGVDRQVVGSALTTLPEVDHRQATSTLSTGAVAIDDTFNSNPAGCRAALAQLTRLSVSSGKRVLVTPGMVELGARQHRENAMFSELAASATTDVIVVGRTNRAALLEGLAAAGAEPAVRAVEDHAAAVAWVRANTGPGDVVLYENQLPDHYP